jgi:CDP-diacylglycerol--serine O-phosphatidyltransferase
VWVDNDWEAPSRLAAGIMGGITALTGLLMVSNFSYFSPKHINFKGRVPFMTLVFVVLGFSLLLVDPPIVLLTLFTLYAASGPVQYLWRRFRSRKSKPVEEGNSDA